MHRLICFELSKIWKKSSFLLSLCVLMILDIFLLWYTNLPDDETPVLSSWKLFQKETAGMTEAEKADYMAQLKETIDGVSFVQEIITTQKLSGEMGRELAEQSMNNNSGVFEAYYDLYRSGNYLRFTDSLQQEKVLINELYEEQQKAASYNEYLQSVQQTKNTLGSISIFGDQDKDSNTFSGRNISKSAEDYADLTDAHIRWMPSKPLEVSMESIWTDILLLLSVFLFVGNLILEEKGKKLFYITRSTRYGIFHSILSKLAALLIHCFVMAFLLYGINLAFCGLTMGFGDLNAAVQSAVIYMESSLSVSVLEYILLSVGTKALVLTSIGAVLTSLCILTDNIVLPCAAGTLFCGISYVLYYIIPAGGKGILLKYLNPAGLLKTENIYGSYLNFNLFGYPVSRVVLSWLVILLLLSTGVILSSLFFVRGENFELNPARDIRMPALRIFKHLYFKPHTGLFRYECYKIMVTNKAVFVFLIFGLLTGSRILSHQYNPSVQEQYYQDFMLQLEGELTEEKENAILAEQARFQEAFDKIGQIDRKVSEGELSEAAGENMKSEWYAVTAFYPSFERILQQYERISDNSENTGKGNEENKSGKFIYDTGYLYLFGTRDDGFSVDLLLLSLGVIMAFGNVIPMEYESGSWNLLSATRQGKMNILMRKALICMAAATVFSFVPFLCRIVNISEVFPLRGLNFPVNNIPYCRDFPLKIPVWGFILLLAAVQAVSVVIVTLAVLAISCWRKNHVQTVFFAILVLAVPLILKLLGFSFAGWFSVYTLYGWSG